MKYKLQVPLVFEKGNIRLEKAHLGTWQGFKSQFNRPWLT